MQLKLKDLELRPFEFDREFAPAELDLGPDFRLVTPLKAKGRAELIEENHGDKKIVQDIRVVGRFSAKVEANCDRCLEQVERQIGGDFDVLQRPQAENTGSEERAISEGETEIGFYEGDSILLEDVLKEQVLLTMPVKTLCQEDCKGLCPQCGLNLNTNACQCASEFQDPRWAALGDLRKKLQN